MKDDSWYINRTNKLIETYGPALTKMQKVDQMYHAQWSATFPGGSAPDWWRDHPISKPRTDLDAAVNMFSTLLPKIKINPLDDSEDGERRANAVEKAIQWQYWLANNRGQVNRVTQNVVFNTLAYGRACVQVHYIPWLREKSGSKKYWDVAGDFLIEPHHPATCFPIMSPYGLEAEVVVKEMSIESVVSVWGDAAKKLEEWKDDTNPRNVLFVDWTDREYRWVACFDKGNAVNQANPTDGTGTLPVGGESAVIFAGENDLPFLNWVDMSTGTTYDKPEDRMRGLLDTIMQFNQWNNANIWHSYQRSSVYRSLERPIGFIETLSGELPKEVTVSGQKYLTGSPGDRLSPIQDAQLDARVLQLKNEDIMEMGISTIPDMLSNPQQTSGVAYATVNEQYSLAKSKVDPFINTAQAVIAGADILMLRWYKHVGEPLTGYEMSYDPLKETYKQTSKRLMISAKTIPADETRNDEGVITSSVIYLTASLTAKIPTDKVQALNGAGILKQVGYDSETILEYLEEEDPTRIIRKRRMEQLTETALQNYIKELAAESDLKIQAAMMKMQQEMMQPPPGQGQPPQDPNAPQGMDQVAPDQITQEQQTQQALAKAGADQDIFASGNEALMEPAQGEQGFDTGKGGASPTQLAPGQTPRKTERGKGKSRRSNR